MKLKSVITHLLTLVVGLSIASSYFLFSLLPSTAQHVVADPQFIELTDEAVSYSELLQQSYLGSLYLRSPVYFFKRQEGYQILAELAERGYTNAARNLYGHHMLKAVFLGSNHEKANIEYAKAHKWAKVAAAQGAVGSLLGVLVDTRSYGAEATPEEIIMVEEFAKNSSAGALGEFVSEYYAKIGDEEKAAEWKTIADEIWASDPPKPACSTITPWKGW